MASSCWRSTWRRAGRTSRSSRRCTCSPPAASQPRARRAASSWPRSCAPSACAHAPTTTRRSSSPPAGRRDRRASRAVSRSGPTATEPRRQRLGSGGEAEVYAVDGRPTLAEKRYRSPSPARERKLRVMLAHPPEQASTASLAWPVELVEEGSRVVGFLMPRIDVARSAPLFSVYNPAQRRKQAPGWDWRYIARTARNVATIVDAVHRAGYVIGDLNESNLL